MAVLPGSVFPSIWKVCCSTSACIRKVAVTDVAADAVTKAGDVHFEAAAEAGGRVLNASRSCTASSVEFPSMTDLPGSQFPSILKVAVVEAGNLPFEVAAEAVAEAGAVPVEATAEAAAEVLLAA